MDKSDTSPRNDVITFGRFELSRANRVLLRDGERIAAGSRAMEILVALTENTGVIVSHRELIERVWQGASVAEGTIRAQVAQLRRILRDADPHSDYVQNVTGRGYRFVAPAGLDRNLPSHVAAIIGRARSSGALVDRLQRQRLVTVVGPGGGGKTTVAVSAINTLADRLPERWHQGVRFVDLAPVADVGGVPATLASALSVTSPAADPLPDVMAYLSGRSMLLLLDNCEHVLDVVARFADQVLRDAPRVHILATSREPLRAAGESVYELPGLAVPPESGVNTRLQMLEYAAVRLFVERAGAQAVAGYSDNDLLRVAEICRRLAGNPLAIEIAASHVELLGLKTSAAKSQDYLYLLGAGWRTAEPRHRTLRATFEWSYGLLSRVEQSVFARLSIFTDSFDLDDAAAALVNETLTYANLFECLVNLVRKSLLVADTAGDKVRYHMLDLVRAYAHEKLHGVERPDIA